MDFIEQILGWSPDNGDGWFEALLFIIPLCGLWLVWRKRHALAQWGRPSRSRDQSH